MPVHTFNCVCGHSWPEYFKLSNWPFPDYMMCPKCMITSGKRQISAPHTVKDYEHPIEMYSVAPVDPNEVRRFAETNPGIQVSLNEDDEMYGVPVVRNEQERRQVMKHFHHVDLGKPKS